MPQQSRDRPFHFMLKMNKYYSKNHLHGVPGLAHKQDTRVWFFFSVANNLGIEMFLGEEKRGQGAKKKESYSSNQGHCCSTTKYGVKRSKPLVPAKIFPSQAKVPFSLLPLLFPRFPICFGSFSQLLKITKHFILSDSRLNSHIINSPLRIGLLSQVGV